MSESSTPLNNDILVSILSISTTKTTTSMMETCRFLYHEGAKVILQQPVILDGSDEKIISLLRFLQAEGFSRCSYVRTTQIFTDPLSETAAKMLVNIVPCMSKLECLSLRAEQSFAAHPYLLPAFASLQTVKILIIVDVRSQSCEMIRTFQSKLLIANILFDPADQLDLSSIDPSRHPLQLLQRSASTLRELMCGYRCDADTEPVESLFVPTYPEVRTLILFNNIAPSPIPYIRAFPNLTYLSSQSYQPITWEYEQLDMSRSQRNVNVMIQNFAQRWTDGPFVWKDIQSYTGPLSDLWALGLTFPIPRLIVKDVPSLRAPLALTEVLASARPVHLTIAYEDQPFSSVLQSDFLDALRSEGAAGLRSIGLSVDVMAGDVDGDLDVGQVLAGIETLLVGLQLSNIWFTLRDITPHEDAPNGEPRVHAHGSEHQPTPGITGTAQSGPVTPDVATEDLASLTLAERTLEEFDVQAFVRRISTSLPGLENIIATVGRPSRCGGTERSVCLGRKNDEAPPNIYTGGKIFYKERKREDAERRWEDMSLNSYKILALGPSLATLSRAQYQGLRSVRAAGEGVFPGVGVAGAMPV